MQYIFFLFDRKCDRLWVPTPTQEYFHFYELVLRQIVASSSATQHPMPPELMEKWSTEVS